MPNQEHEREREIKHIATGTYPQPEGELLPPRHGERRNDDDGHRRGIPPSGRVPEQGPDWFLVATEACGGGTPGLGYVLEVSVFIGFFGIGNKSGGP